MTVSWDMAPISSIEETLLGEQDQKRLLDIAHKAILQGLAKRGSWSPPMQDYAGELSSPGASFVTLTRQGNLRGCIGSLQAARPLVQDVANNAYAAAFSDPRFPPLRKDELAGLTIRVSVLGSPERMHFRDRDDLMQQLRPGIDGLILEEGPMHGTFLPSVWESVPDPDQFLRHLNHKAGLPPDYWSDTLRISRYTTQSFAQETDDLQTSDRNPA